MNWFYLLVGLWLAASPWLVGTLGLNLVWNNLVFGGLVALLALWQIFGRKRR